MEEEFKIKRLRALALKKENELRNKRECTVCCEQISSPDEWMVL